MKNLWQLLSEREDIPKEQYISMEELDDEPVDEQYNKAIHHFRIFLSKIEIPSINEIRDVIGYYGKDYLKHKLVVFFTRGGERDMMKVMAEAVQELIKIKIRSVKKPY